MADVALVQHSPWGGDGGAEETHYGWECLEYLLAAPDGTPQRPDVLYFNWGLHNIGNGTLPGQAGPIAECEFFQFGGSRLSLRLTTLARSDSVIDAPYLEKIAQRLASLRPATKLVFGITTPEMCSAASDAVVQSNNRAAVAIMAKYGIPTADMHTAIIGQCGPAPNTTCFGQSTCFCPHCPQDNGVGYRFLANNVIVPAIKAALAE